MKNLSSVALLIAVVFVLTSTGGSSPVASASAGEEEQLMKIIDFSEGSPTWRSIDDVVMGGRSSSRMVLENGAGVFAGTVSLANNGGFASVRSLPAEHDLSPCDGLVLKVRGDGRSYKLRLRTNDSFDGVSYQATISPDRDRWQEIVVPFDLFEPVFRGRRVAGYEALDSASIRTIGFLIADKQEGPFRLEISWIAGFHRATEDLSDGR